MSQFFLAKYQPIADALLKEHGLSVPEDTRDMLTKTIANCRVVLRKEGTGPHSPLPAARKALTHANKLLEYARTPPRRKTSVATRCERLRTALLDSGILALELGMRNVRRTFDYGALLDSLETCQLNEAWMTELVVLLKEIKDPKGWQKIGRPWGLAKRIIRGGCMVWRIAGHPRLTYRWDDVTGELRGPLPDFLRDLIACCNGTHELVRSMAREQHRPSHETPRAHGLHLSDSSLKLAIIQCQHDDKLTAHLKRRAQKRRTKLT